MKNDTWLNVEPMHCHQRIAKNTLVSKLRIVSADKSECELLMKFNPVDLDFFFDHEIDHLPGMLEVCALRQSALAIAHLVYNVPMDYITVLEWLNVNLYNFGELNTETFVRSKLIDSEREESKITLILEGLMVQKDYPTMKMRGKLIAFNPKFAAKLRHKKVPLDKFREKEAAQKPLIAEVHIMIKRDLWQQAYQAIVKELKRTEISRYSLVPLYVTYDVEDTELRLCLKFEDAALIDKFIVNKIRVIPGIESTRVRLTLDGEIFPRGIKALASDNGGYDSAHIFLKIEPSKDAKVWEALSNLSESEAVFPTWIFRDFYEYDRDVTLRLMGKDKQIIKEYVEDHISKIDGILSYKMKFMSQVEKIAGDDKLMNLSKQWLKIK